VAGIISRRELPAFARSLERTLDRWYEKCTDLRLASKGPFTVADKEAMITYESGQAETLPAAYRLQGLTKEEARKRAAHVRWLEDMGEQSALSDIDSARAQGELIRNRLLAQKLEAAEEGLAVLRGTLQNEEASPELKVRVAQDFLDRVNETSKIQRQEISQGPTLQLPGSKIEGLLAAMSRASAAAARSPMEIQTADRLLLPTPEAAVVSPSPPSDAPKISDPVATAPEAEALLTENKQ
jgi:hypothetical protein